MLRASTTRSLVLYKLTPRAKDYILASSVRFVNGPSKVDGKVVPPTKTQDSQNSSSGSSQNRQTFYWAFGGVALGGGLLLTYNDDTRFWIVENIPLTKGLFSSLGLTVNRPIAACNPCLIKKYLDEKKVEPPKDGPLAHSILDVADKSVAAISVDKAIIKDHNKSAAKTREAVDKICKSNEIPVLKQLSTDGSCVDVKKPKKTDFEGSAFMQAAEDSAKLFFIKRPSTPEEIAERNRLEEERHQQRLKEQQERDAEYFQKQKEKAERKAAEEIEKERKLQVEEKQAAERLLLKIQKNQEFELRASKDISNLCEMVESAIKTNIQAIDTCRQHAAKLREAMDASNDEEAVKIWPLVHEFNEMRLQRLEHAHKTQQEVETKIIEYIQFLDNARSDEDTRNNETIPSYRKQIQQLAFDVKSVYDKLKSQETVSNVMKHYYCILNKDKADFKKELEAIVPQVKLGDKGLNLCEEELNALLAHAHRRIFQLKRQLMEQQLLERQRLEDALCEQRKIDIKEASVKVGVELDKQFNELMLEKENELMAQTKLFETELKSRLARQASEHQDHLQDMLALQQKKLMEQFDLALRERLIHERHVFIEQIIKNIAKLKGLEAALEERADIEKIIVEVQDIMSSSLCLMHAVAHEVDCSGKEYEIIRLEESLKKCAQAGEQNSFVQAILSSVPKLAAERGIYSISSLERRFENVYNQCSKVAFYPETDSLFWRMMSHVRLWLHMNMHQGQVKYSSACDFGNPENMSSIELLEQAKYFMKKKCLAEAVRCVVHLSGTPRALAQEWLEEARLVLEVRQAAEVLLSYAQSIGMGTIF